SANDDSSDPHKATQPGNDEHNRWQHFWQRLRHTFWRVVEWQHTPHYLIAFFTLFLVIFAYYAWDESSKGTIALQGQLTELRNQQRPWVYAAAVQPAGRISLENGMYFVPLIVTIQNKGHLPAFSVVQKTDATIMAIGQKSISSVQNVICDNYRQLPPEEGVGDTIFPEQRIIHGGFRSDDYPRVEQKNGRN
ncbi:MAG: hypothetical protein AB7H71_10015, partial [Alphaproteobacteria bacterium]